MLSFWYTLIPNLSPLHCLVSAWKRIITDKNCFSYSWWGEIIFCDCSVVVSFLFERKIFVLRRQVSFFASFTQPIFSLGLLSFEPAYGILFNIEILLTYTPCYLSSLQNVIKLMFTMNNIICFLYVWEFQSLQILASLQLFQRSRVIWKLSPCS